SIAEAAGGNWPERAREIAARTADADQTKRVSLLADIRDIFAERDADRIKSADLTTALVMKEGHPWAEYGKTGKALSANSLARMLSSDHITPKTIRFGAGANDTAKGYELEQFADAFARYLPPSPKPTVTPSQTEDFCGLLTSSQPSQGNGC